MSDITIRYAQTDDDVIVIHRFLCVVAGPMLPGPIDPKKSIEEVWRVCQQDVGLMAVLDETLVGTIGLTQAEFWWSNIRYLANRWAFCLPHSRAWKPLLREAKAIAVASELEFHLISEERGKITIFNKNKLRGNNVLRRHQDQDREEGREPSIVAH